MGAPERRCVENDVPPGGECLSPAEARSVQEDCARELELGTRRLVEACPPQTTRGAVTLLRNGPTLYVGLLGQAYGFLHLYDRTRDPDHLRLAHEYLDAASPAIERSSIPPPEEWLSFHATAGVSAVAAVVRDRLGETEASERCLEDYRRLAVAAADPDYPTEDLLWGRGGFLFGAAFLRAALGEESIADELVEPALAAMIATGRRHASEHAGELTPGPHGSTPLLYLNFNPSLISWFARGLIGSRSAPAQWLARQGARAFAAWENRSLQLTHRYDASLVHGLPGNLYLMMHFPELLAGQPDWERDVIASLDCLTDCLDAELGMLELLPSPRSEASQKRRGTDRFTERVHWCGGTPGMVFVFSRAFTVFGHGRYREAAELAANHAWKHGLVCKGNGICHGVAGNGYAFLALHRATSDPTSLGRALHFARHSLSPRLTLGQRTPDRPWSLYEGAMGTLCFYADCLEPATARFPGFEV